MALRMKTITENEKKSVLHAHGKRINNNKTGGGGWLVADAGGKHSNGKL